MRKLIVQEWMSLDGYVADKNGKLNFFTNIDRESNKYSDHDQLKLMEGCDTILLGRKTYELFVEFWPTATTDIEIIADKLNSTKKMVCSNTLANASWGKWPKAEIIKGDAIEAIRSLKMQQGRDIIVWGSISLVQSLLKAQLIDEIHIQLCPTITGGGRALFPGADTYLGMKLLSLKTYDTGLIFLRYAPNSQDQSR